MIPLFKVATNVEQALKNVEEVLRSGYVGQGHWCERFEEGVKRLSGHKRFLYVNSGTSALQLAYHLAGVGPGTEVISTPITCIATNTAIVALGGSIVWADVNPKTGLIDPKDVIRKVTSRTRAIVGVDWGGRGCDWKALREGTRGISLIEDAAHRIPGAFPSQGDFICYSFQAIKHLHTADGGGLVCPSDATHERAKLLRWFGLDRTRSDSMRCYQPIDEAGWKFQPNDVLAAIGCANLEAASWERRESGLSSSEIAEIYAHDLSGSPFVYAPAATFMPWLYTILVSSPAAFEHFAAERGVMVSQVHARNDIYGCFKEFQDGHLPGVDFFAAHQVSIPCGWWMEPAQVSQVVQMVKDWALTPEARWSME